MGTKKWITHFCQFVGLLSLLSWSHGTILPLKTFNPLGWFMNWPPDGSAVCADLPVGLKWELAGKERERSVLNQASSFSGSLPRTVDIHGVFAVPTQVPAEKSP